MVTIVWWLVCARAVLGSIFAVIGVQMVLYARDERTIRRARGDNGMQDEILTGQMRLGWLYVVRLGLLATSAGLALPFIGYVSRMYRWQQVVASSFVLVLTLIDVGALIMKWQERSRLLWMAADYRRKTKAEGGRGGNA